VIDDQTLRRRLAARVSNDFGKSAEELAMVLGWNATTEATYRGSARPSSTQPVHFSRSSMRCSPQQGSNPTEVNVR
jgi:hypothetical protein